jgi:hypothetical protein
VRARRGALLTLEALAVLSLAACQGAPQALLPCHPVGDAAPEASNDGGMEAQCVNDRPVIIGGQCNSTADAICQKWADQAAAGACGHSRCLADPVTHLATCNGAYCDESDGCWCTPDHKDCKADEVCVGGPSGGSLHCVPVCGR